MKQALIVAIDGPSGSGKSSVARAVAQRFGLQYLDTGAMYRAFAWWSMQGHTDMSTCPLVVSTSPEHARVLVGDTDITQAIREQAVTERVSAVASDPEVRVEAVRRQRGLIAEARIGMVVEGRDITSVVAPDAQVRVFLTADLAAREARRAAEFDDAATAEAMRATIAARDAVDTTRTHSPLLEVDGVTRIDTTHLTLQEVVDTVSALVQQEMEGGAA